FLDASVGEWTINEGAERMGFDKSRRAIQKLAAAGVPIVVGSEAGGSPYHEHGPTTLREIELLGEAGGSPADVIAAATRTPAAMLGLGDQIGTVEVGKHADLVVVRDDPLADLGNLRSVRFTVRDGVAHTPGEWMGSDAAYTPAPRGDAARSEAT